MPRSRRFANAVTPDGHAGLSGTASRLGPAGRPPLARRSPLARRTISPAAWPAGRPPAAATARAVPAAGLLPAAGAGSSCCWLGRPIRAASLLDIMSLAIQVGLVVLPRTIMMRAIRK